MTADNMKFNRQTAIFALFSILFLWLIKGDLLYHMEQYSYFSSSGDFLAKFFEQPGGLLALLGAFLTQFCHFPVLGAIVIALSLSLLAYLVRKAFGLEGKKALLALAPSLFLLLFITSMDYTLYHQKTYGLLFSQTLGFCAAVALFMLYRRRLAGKKLGWLFVVPLIIAGYPLIGSYAIVAAVLVVVEALRVKNNFLPALASTLVLGAAVPFLCANLPGLYGRMNRHFAYFAGFPYFEFVGSFWGFVPLILAFIALIALVFADSFGRRVPVPAFVASALIMLGLTNWDPNFGAVLKMERAVGDRDWDKVLQIAAKHQEPTRAQVLYRNIALYQKGQLTERMFTFPDGAAPLKTTADVPISMICSVPVEYYSGMINSCERSSMEFSSAFSKSVYFFKYQTKVALMKGDFELAQKYLDAVSRSWFQGPWLRRYQAFIDNPALMDSEPEFAVLRPIMEFSSPDTELASSLEMCMLHHFENLEYVNENAFEWQAATMLSWKEESFFIQLFFDRFQKHPEAPISKGVAEALALLGGTSGDYDIMARVAQAMSTRQDVLKQFTPFANAMNMASNPDSPETIKRFKDRYGNTYWFYYYFINDIRTN